MWRLFDESERWSAFRLVQFWSDKRLGILDPWTKGSGRIIHCFTNEALMPVSVASGRSTSCSGNGFCARYFGCHRTSNGANNDPKNRKFQAVSSDLNYFHKPYSVVLIDMQELVSEGWLEGFVPAIRLNVQIRTNSDDARLGIRWCNYW